MPDPARGAKKAQDAQRNHQTSSREARDISRSLPPDGLPVLGEVRETDRHRSDNQANRNEQDEQNDGIGGPPPDSTAPERVIDPHRLSAERALRRDRPCTSPMYSARSEPFRPCSFL
jgi:hypothetical protein